MHFALRRKRHIYSTPFRLQECLFSRKLKRLNLGGNGLTTVPQKSLGILDTLKKLEMQENRITEIKEGDFEGSFHYRFFSPPVVKLRNHAVSIERGLIFNLKSHT